MLVKAHFCDLCRTEGILRVAVGFYETDEDQIWDACPTHLKEVKRYGFRVVRFASPGDVNPDFIAV